MVHIPVAEEGDNYKVIIMASQLLMSSVQLMSSCFDSFSTQCTLSFDVPCDTLVFDIPCHINWRYQANSTRILLGPFYFLTLLLKPYRM